MTGLISRYGYLAVMTVVGMEALGVPLPGETTLIAAALYASATHRLQILGIILAAVAGATGGGCLGYLIGHWGGYRLLVRYGGYVRLGQKQVKVARYLFQRHGDKVVLLGRFVPVLRAYASFLAGTGRMPWWPFLLFNAVGAGVWASAYGLGAYFVGRQIESLSRPLAIGFGAAGLVVLAAGVLLIRRQEKALEAVAEVAFPGPLEGYPGGPPL